MTDTEDGTAYETVYAAASDGGYEWAEVRLLRRPDGALAVLAASGCSCDTYEDYLKRADLEWHFDRSRAYRDFRGGLYHTYFSGAQAFEHYAKMLRALGDHATVRRAVLDDTEQEAPAPTFFEPDITYIENEPYRAPELNNVFQCASLAPHPGTAEPLAFGFTTAAYPGNRWNVAAVDRAEWGDGRRWLPAAFVGGAWVPRSGSWEASGDE